MPTRGNHRGSPVLLYNILGPLLCYAAEEQELFAFYSGAYQNLCRLSHSLWAVAESAEAGILESLRARGALYREGCQVARLAQLRLTPVQRQLRAESDVCPVTLTSRGLCQQADDAHRVLYNEKVYSLLSEDACVNFCKDPDSFLVPSPARAALLPFSKRIVTASGPLMFDGHCAVKLLAGEVQRATAFYVEYGSGTYAISDEEGVRAFLAKPQAYVGAQLPAKTPLPPSQDPSLVFETLTKARAAVGDELVDHLTYLQVCVASAVSDGLLAVGGEGRVLYPGIGGKSTLLHLAKHLRAKNPLNTDRRQEQADADLEHFLADCKVPANMQEYIAKKHRTEEGQGQWTKIDERRYRELRDRFDELFGFPRWCRR